MPVLSKSSPHNSAALHNSLSRMPRYLPKFLFRSQTLFVYDFSGNIKLFSFVVRAGYPERVFRLNEMYNTGRVLASSVINRDLPYPEDWQIEKYGAI